MLIMNMISFIDNMEALPFSELVTLSIIKTLN